MLDLRGNPGGLLLEGVAVSSIFIEDGRIVSVRGRHRAERVHNAQGDAILPKDVPWSCSWTAAARAPPRS